VTAPADPTPAPPGDVVLGAAAAVAACADRVVANLDRALAGKYTAGDALADACASAATAASLTAEAAAGGWASWWSTIQLFFSPPPSAPQPSSRVPVQVDPAITDRPLTLATAGFRAIGYGPEYFVHAVHVSFEPPQLDAATDTWFMVNVNVHHLPGSARKKTIVFEGEVVAAQTGRRVTEPVRFVKPAFSD
jgi:hypothetical protein